LKRRRRWGKKKSGLIVTIAVVLVLSLVAAGGGWMVGGLIAPQVDRRRGNGCRLQVLKGKDAEKEEEAENKPRENVVPLEPITTNLSYPSDNWIRIEVSLCSSMNPTRRSPIRSTRTCCLSAHRIASADRRAARLSVFARGSA
jgi:flagellar basal body-associated protein FliL